MVVRLVEQQEGRGAQDGAGDRDALALAARQRDAALADHRVEPLRQAADELGGGGELGGARDLAVARLGSPEADVVADARREDGDVLRHQRDA
jgi:hypothetical protein